MEVDDQTIEKWHGKNVDIEEDTCGRIDEAKKELVKNVNKKYQAIQGNSKVIEDKNIDMSAVKVVKKVEREKIKDGKKNPPSR